MSRSNLIVGLDIGTTKVCAIVGEADEQGVDILGIGSFPTEGLRKGVVINIESTVESILRAVEEAEIQSNCEINSVYVGVTGGHIKSMMSHGVAALRNGVVGKQDLERVMEAAGAVVIPADREVIHLLPCEFVVDEQVQKDPVGMPGVRFEVNCHIITAASASIMNILACCKQAGLAIDGVVFEPLAGSHAVLMPSERENGVALLDIGGGTSDLIIMRYGSVIHSAALALGGNHVTNDISQVLKVPISPTAESLKKKYGAALRELAGCEELEAAIPGAREPSYVSRETLVDIIEKRMEEIFKLVRAEMDNSGFGVEARTGIVLTGGCALLPGIEKLAERVFEMPARVGIPTGFGGRNKEVSNPMYTTGVGLVLYAMSGAQKDQWVRIEGNPSFEGIWNRMKDWIINLF